MIFAREISHRIQRIEPEDSHELHLTLQVTPQQMSPAITFNLPTSDARENLCFEQRLVGSRIIVRSPTTRSAAAVKVIDAGFAATCRFGSEMSPRVKCIRPDVPRRLARTFPLSTNGLRFLGARLEV